MLLDDIKYEFAKRIETKYSEYEFNVNKSIAQKVISKLSNNAYDYTNEKIIINNKSFLELFDYYKNEINKITIMENNIPDNIEVLLSPYGTFYDGGNIFYYKNELSPYDALLCIINHITHYSSGMYYHKYNYKKNMILRFITALNLVETTEEWDFSTTIIKYFDRIYKDELKNIIVFEPSEYYSKYIMEKIEQNQFGKAIFLNSDEIVIYLKEIETSYIMNHVISVRTFKSHSNISCTFVRTKLLKIDDKYNTIPLKLEKLLINNGFEILKR